MLSTAWPQWKGVPQTDRGDAPPELFNSSKPIHTCCPLRCFDHSALNLSTEDSVQISSQHHVQAATAEQGRATAQAACIPGVSVTPVTVIHVHGLMTDGGAEVHRLRVRDRLGVDHCRCRRRITRGWIAWRWVPLRSWIPLRRVPLWSWITLRGISWRGITFRILRVHSMPANSLSDGRCNARIDGICADSYNGI